MSLGEGTSMSVCWGEKTGLWNKVSTPSETARTLVASGSWQPRVLDRVQTGGCPAPVGVLSQSRAQEQPGAAPACPPGIF